MSSDLLNIGASGLRAYRASLAVTGDNIANAQTPGYARRSLRLSEVSIGGLPDFRYRNRTRFDGVDISATVRASDEWRTGDARLAASLHGRAQAKATWMINTETALADGETGTGAALAKMFAAGDALAADPLSRAPRSAFLASIDDAAASIRNNATELSRISAGVADAANASVDGLNANLAALADLNLAIRRTSAGSTANAELADQRDVLIDKITAQTDASVAIAADGSATLTRAGATLLANGDAAALMLTIAPDGRSSFTQTFNASTTVFTPSGGALGGLTVSANMAADRRAALDTLATNLATALNNWHAGGRTPGNSNGAPLLDASGGAIALAALIADPTQVAAADTGGAANGNMLALSTVRSASGVEGQWAALVANQAQTTASARADESRTSARKDTADAARDAVEGVDLDREAADLLRYQQAYEASARIIQMAKETVDTILGLFR
jgi:flagellar hook-associated protein 1